MQDPNQELQHDTQEEIKYMESAEEHESKPSAGDEPPMEQYLCPSYAEDGKLFNCQCGKCEPPPEAHPDA